MLFGSMVRSVPAPGEGADLERCDSTLCLDSLNPILINSVLEIHTDCGGVSSAVSLALGLVGDSLSNFDKYTENKTQSPPSLVYYSLNLI